MTDIIFSPRPIGDAPSALRQGVSIQLGIYLPIYLPMAALPRYGRGKGLMYGILGACSLLWTYGRGVAEVICVTPRSPAGGRKRWPNHQPTYLTTYLLT